jgi:hypothetical protein
VVEDKQESRAELLEALAWPQEVERWSVSVSSRGGRQRHGKLACSRSLASVLGLKLVLLEEDAEAVQILGSEGDKKQGQWWSMVDRMAMQERVEQSSIVMREQEKCEEESSARPRAED